MDYFYSAAELRSSGALWPIFAPAFISSFSALPGGSYSLSAKYLGDPSFNPSSSAVSPFTIVPASPTITAQSTLYSLVTGDTATVLADIEAKPNGGVGPTGTVTISSKGSVLATASNPIINGFSILATAQITASQLSPGPNILTVNYSGDSNYAGASTSITLDYAGNGGFSINPIAPITIANSPLVVPVTLVPSGGFVGDVEFECSVTGPTASGDVTCSAPPAYLTGSGPTSEVISVSAASSASGTYTATLSGSNNLNRKIQASTTFTITLGTSPAPAFAIISNGNLNVSPGSTVGTVSSVSIITSGGIAGQLNLSCAVATSMSNAVSSPTCTVPSSVNVTASGAWIVPVSVATTAATTSGAYTFSVTASDSASPTVTGSSTADLLVSSSPQFTLAGTGTANYAPGTSTGNTTTVNANSLNGYSGTINLTCILTGLSPSVMLGASYPICTIPSTLVLSANSAASFTLALSATGNPAYPPPGTYLATISGYDTAQTNIASQTAIQVVVGNPGLTLSNSGSLSLSPGATTGNTSTITVTPQSGFTGTVNLSCSISTSIASVSDAPTCSIASSIDIASASAATTTLTVHTTASTTSSLRRIPRSLIGGAEDIVIGVAFLCVLPLSKRPKRVLFGLVVGLTFIAVVGCGGGGAGDGGGGGGGHAGTTPGNYTITIVGKDAASGKVTGATSLSLTVN